MCYNVGVEGTFTTLLEVKGVTMIDTFVIDHLAISDPEIMGGTPVFKGTRVPIKYLLDWLGGGYTLDEFLDNYPSVSREQAKDVLEVVSAWLVAHVRTNSAA